MSSTLRTVLMLAMTGLVAQPAFAHSIGIRSGGGSTDVCDEFGDPTGAWVEFLEGEQAPEEADYLNNCGVEIFSIDFQFSPDSGDTISHPPDPVEAFMPSESGDPDNIFDSLQLIQDTEFGDVYRFFSSQGNTIDCVGCDIEIDLVSLSLMISPNFVFYAFADNGQAGFVRIVNINQQAVPEPATLLLLGSGLAGLAMRLRRRRPRTIR